MQRTQYMVDYEGERDFPVLGFVEKVASGPGFGLRTVEGWNDLSSTTHDQVLFLLDKLIAARKLELQKVTP